MTKKKTKKRISNSHKEDTAQASVQQQSATTSYQPEHKSDTKECFAKFINRHHSLCFCLVMLIITITYGIFLGTANSNLKKSQERIVSCYDQVQKQTTNNIHAFIEQSVAHRKELQSCLDKQMMCLSNACSSKDSLSAGKIFTKLYTDIEYLREQNACITRIASDTLSLQYKNLISSVMSEKMLELHLNKIEHEYTNITVWASVLTIIFLVFSFFSLFKIEQSRKEIEDLRRKGEEDINGTIANATNIFNGLRDQINSTIDPYKETLESLITEYQSKLNAINKKDSDE